MEIKQNKFAFFANFAETIQTLPPEKQALAYKALCEYGIYEILPEDESLRMMCLMAKASLYKEDGRKNNGGNHNPSGKNQHTDQNVVNSGQSGQSWSKLVKVGQFLSKQETETEIETKRDSIEKKTTKPIRGAFVPPTLEEVLEHAKQMNSITGMGGFICSRQTATDFFNQYDRQGWILGNGNHMSNWKSGLRLWANKEEKNVLGQ